MSRRAVKAVLLVLVLWWVPVLLALAQVNVEGLEVDSKDLTALCWKIFETTWGDLIVRYTVLTVGSTGWLLRSWRVGQQRRRG